LTGSIFSGFTVTSEVGASDSANSELAADFPGSPGNFTLAFPWFRDSASLALVAPGYEGREEKLDLDDFALAL